MASEKPLNETLILLLEKYYAYPEEKQQDFYLDLEGLRKGKSIRNKEDIKEAIKIFKNDHLYLIEEKESPASDKPCVTQEGLSLHIQTFWCGNNRFGEEFLTGLESVLKGLKRNDTLEIDLRGNGGGGDPEMEFALYPFVEQGSVLYDYQFKVLTSPHLFARFISKFATTFGLESFLSNFWGGRRSYYFAFQETGWRPEHIKRLKALKKVVQDLELKILLNVDQKTGSASELYAAILKDLRNCGLKGERTKGSVGAPNIYSISNSPYKIAIPAVRVWRVNGEVLEGKGLIP